MGISYSVEVDEERSAKAMGREMTISKKDAVELCRHVKGMPTGEAWDTLRSIADGEDPVPIKKHNSGVGHRAGVDGWDAGRFPKKAAEALLDILYNAEANADDQGYDPDEMVVEHIAAHKVGESRGVKPRAMGRASDWNSDLVDIEVVLLQEDYKASGAPDEEEEGETETETEESEAEAEKPEEEAQVPEELTDIDAVGEAKAEALRGAGFEGVDDLREATQDEIAEAESVGKALAARIKTDVGGVEVDEEPEGETEEAEEEEAEDDTEEKEGVEDDTEETEMEPEEAEEDTEETEEGGGDN